jgi:hypothetical protein
MVTVNAAATVRVNVVVLMIPPVEVPVIVIVNTPAGVVALVVIVMTEVNVGLPDAGLKPTVVPVGWPDAVSDTDCVVPDVRVAVTVAVVLAPGETVAALGLTPIV